MSVTPAPTGPLFTTVQRQLPNAPEAASTARRVVDELAGAGFSAALLEDLRLLVSEVVTNAVRHAPAGGEIGFTVRARGTARVRVEVADPGHGFGYEGPAGSLDDEGGWGLYLVDQLASRWGIDEEPTTTVWFELIDRPATVARVDEATLFDAIGAAVIATDPEGIVTHWNRGAEQLFGYERTAVIGRPITDLLVGEGDDRAAEAIMQRIRDGESWEGEWDAPRKDGTRVGIFVSNAPVRDARGALVGVVGISIDVSEQRRARHELRRSEERLRVALEAGAMGTWEWDAAAGTVSWSEALERIHGLEPGSFPGTFEAFQRDIHPEDRERVLAAIDGVVRGGEDYAIEYRIVRPDGQQRWLSARARPIRNEDGEVARLVGVCTDVTARVAAERRLMAQHAVASVLAEAESVEEVAPAILDALGEPLGWRAGAVYLVDEDAEVLRCVGTWVRTGRTADTYVEGTRAFAPRRGQGLPGRVWEQGEPVWIEDATTDPHIHRGPAVARDGLHAAVAFPLRLGARVVGVLEFFDAEIHAPDEDLLRTMGAVGSQIGLVVERRRAEEQRVAMLEREQAARAEAEEASDRLSFLAEASIVLNSSLDHRRTLAELANLAVPRLADWCAIDVLDTDGAIQPLVVAHADPARLALAEEYRLRFPPHPEDDAGAAKALRTGEAELLTEIPDGLLEASITDPEQLAMIRQLGLRSAMILPLVARGRTLGALTLAVGEDDGRRFDEDDLRFARHLARRAALSLDNARLYEDRTRIARTLQRSLLPPSLPSVPDLEIAAVYQAASIERNDVGGDFYDAFELGRDTWAMAIGDVCGKGVDAAAVTGLVRHTLRAEALRGPTPAPVLVRLHDALRRHEVDRFSTVALAFLRPEPVGARCIVACGGHPLPMLLRSDGSVETIGVVGTVLGVLDEVEVDDRATHLGPGDALVLYTDGILDPRREHGVDEEGLAALLAACAGMDAATIAERLSDAVEDPTSAPDDVAILVVRARPE
jgi:PAS domain S-box-containing protein